ncbi:MAG: hypothetical protein IKJ82_03905 [Oscillospiraceae bacterium]|nr:hypothetical protein [Oscillospiraceae bacterium]
MKHYIDDFRTMNNGRLDIVFDSDTHVYSVVVSLVDKEPFEVPFSDLNEANKFAFAFIRAYNTIFLNCYF